MNLRCLIISGCLCLATALAEAQAPAADLASGFSGKVVATTNTSGYTYVQVDTGAKTVWAACNQIAVNVGDTVTVGSGVAMTGYHSKSLNRDFDVVYFTGLITVNGSTAGSAPALPPGHPPLPGSGNSGLPPGHPPLTAVAQAASIDVRDVKRAEGGKTIKEIYAGKDALAGQPVLVRGKVVKYNAMILGKNWLHIQDGSGSADAGDNDLPVTTATPAALGDTVLVSGNVSTNRDFGAGYKYRVILEDAKVTVE
jgi:hypothetical protein